MSIFGPPTAAKDTVFCTRCGFTGPHSVTREITGGQWATLVALLLCFVIPGVVYAVHLGTGGGSRYVRVCPKCRAQRMWVPLDSPAAKAAGVVAPPPPSPSATEALAFKSGNAIGRALGRKS
jgi:hypothetical protein